ncbi:MAG: nitrophenyl compound nitroreductase subunit ArsF family protein [Bacteroidetes bacterium]|nr:nitrophenyl compound nitroreductase subunit ArsF family protein [Bacteroidota bacterium]
MKKSMLFFLMIIVVPVLFAGNPLPTTKIEVYYFHFTRRCSTCQNLENVSKKAVETLYPEKVKKGEISFQSVNLDEKAGEALGARYKVDGQTLLVICGDKKIDLTEKGFLYANNSPDKLTAEIRKAVDGMMK